MPFEKHFDLEISELNHYTRYRFAELEMGRLLALPPNPDVWQLYLMKWVIKPTFHTDDEYREISHHFYDIISTRTFREPKRRELLDYLRYHDQGYRYIQKNFGISSRTIAKYRFIPPEHFPYYKYWNEETYQAWQIHKRNFNLWNENVIQTKEK